ncbi:MAG TPA: hypothetical protein VHB27_20755 [Rhodopila sp.]|uniref:hypothetical protein n=1 Tax=Rhodopila sp. TaxID=2480087 RepID=UPI002C17A84E|nr:hypothetical protein [Rhodopila sp.]HVY17662.1 hypothetical protein [Rhodopila sp.]
MTNGNFEARMKAAGLKLPPEEVAKLQALVSDLDRAAGGLRGPMSYALEPLSALRLTPSPSA